MQNNSNKRLQDAQAIAKLLESKSISFKNTEIVATPKIIKETKVPIILLVAEIGSTTDSR